MIGPILKGSQTYDTRVWDLRNEVIEVEIILIVEHIHMPVRVLDIRSRSEKRSYLADTHYNGWETEARVIVIVIENATEMQTRPYDTYESRFLVVAEEEEHQIAKIHPFHRLEVK